MSETVDIRDTAAGLVGAFCCVYVGMPFDTVKLRLQTMRGVYAGPIACAITLATREGVPSLWSGATPVGSYFSLLLTLTNNKLLVV